MIKGVDYTGVSVVYILIDRERGLLSSLRSSNCRDEHGKRDLGGGGVKFNEKLADGMKRELKEELNINDDSYIMHELGFREIFRGHEGKKTHWISFEYLIILKSDVIIENMEPNKHEELKFFPFDNLPPKDKVHSHYYYILSEFKDKIFELSGVDLILS
jgi:8-oxo-dGTP pyrophosphatase MutT (NUDIX family)